jgi:hypothetical protein
MSDQLPPQIMPPPRPRRHIAISIIMVLFGIILLLPGFCALVYAIPLVAVFGGRTQDLVGFGMLWAICLLIAFGGVMLLRKAFK